MRPAERIAASGIVLLFGLLAGARSAAAGPIALTLDPSALTLDVGEEFFVDVGIQGLPADNPLFLFDITLLVGGAMPSAVTPREPSDAEIAAIDPAPYLSGIEPATSLYLATTTSFQGINAVNCFFGPPVDPDICAVAEDGLLFRAFFVASAPGSALISFGPVTLFGATPPFDPNEPPPLPPEIVAELDATAAIDVVSTAAPIPEPATLLLVGGGIAAAFRRRVRKQFGAL